MGGRAGAHLFAVERVKSSSREGRAHRSRSLVAGRHVAVPAAVFFRLADDSDELGLDGCVFLCCCAAHRFLRSGSRARLKVRVEGASFFAAAQRIDSMDISEGS